MPELEAGRCAFYVLVAADGSVLGRFSLYELADGTANLGYRAGRDVAGQGAATAAVRELCRLAPARHGLRTLRAATSRRNVASQRVLAKAGFVPVGTRSRGSRSYGSRSSANAASGASGAAVSNYLAAITRAADSGTAENPA